MQKINYNISSQYRITFYWYARIHAHTQTHVCNAHIENLILQKIKKPINILIQCYLFLSIVSTFYFISFFVFWFSYFCMCIPNAIMMIAFIRVCDVFVCVCEYDRFIRGHYCHRHHYRFPLLFHLLHTFLVRFDPFIVSVIHAQAACQIFISNAIYIEFIETSHFIYVHPYDFYFNLHFNL